MPRKRRKTPRVGVFWDPRYVPTREFVAGLAEYISRHEPWELYGSVVMKEGEPVSPLDPMEKWKGDGLIGAFFRQHERTVAAVARRGIPVVNTGGGLPDPGPGKSLGHVYVDGREIGQLAAEHLLSLGYRHFACCKHHRWYAKGRCAGFQARLAEAGFECNVHPLRHAQIFSGSGKIDTSNCGAKWLVKLPKPVGIFTPDDSSGVRVIRAARAFGFDVPGDVAVVGCYNDVLACSFALVSLTSVDCPFQQIGYRGAALLDRMMRGKPAPKKSILLPPVKVVQRQSTDIASDADGEVTKALRFIRANAYSPIHLEDVLDKTRVSRKTLQRRFRETLGHGVYQEIQKLRIERARQLLKETSLTVTRISSMAGFRDARHLCIVFREKLDLTPTEYRLTHQPAML